MFGNIGPLEIGVVLIIALIVFGPKRLPELGSGLGKGMREFKESLTGDHRDDDSQEEAARAIGAPKATVTHVETPTTHRVEANPVAVAAEKDA